MGNLVVGLQKNNNLSADFLDNSNGFIFIANIPGTRPPICCQLTDLMLQELRLLSRLYYNNFIIFITLQALK